MNNFTFMLPCRSQWPLGLRLKSSAARLLRLWVRILPGTWMFVVSVVCCQVEVSATDWSLVQRSPTDCGVSSRKLENEEAKARYRAVKIQPHWVVTPGKQTNIPVTVHRNRFLFNNQPDALINQIYYVIKLYMFRASSLPIISSLLYIRQW